MTDATHYHALVDALLADPEGFDDRGGAMQLLDIYFEGLSVETLRPLLMKDDIRVQRVAAFVASELGGDAQPLLDELARLVWSKDVHVAS